MLDTSTRSVTLSVVSHAQAELAKRLLGDLTRLAPPELARIVVTCNVPEEFEAPAELPFELRVIHRDTPIGFGANHNRAFRLCETPFYAIANPDVRVAANPFPVLVDALKSGRALAAPAVHDPAGRLEDSARMLVTPIDILFRRLGWRRAEFDCPAWLAGMFLVFDSEAFRRLGGFDEKFFMYCEDADICARTVLESDGIAFCPEASVVHDARRASRRSLRPLFWHVASLMKFWVSPTFWSYWRYLRSDKVRATVFRSQNH